MLFGNHTLIRLILDQDVMEYAIDRRVGQLEGDITQNGKQGGNRLVGVDRGH